MKITLLYQVSCYIRVKKQRNIKSWDQQNYLVIRGLCYIRPLYNEVPLYYVNVINIMSIALHIYNSNKFARGKITSFNSYTVRKILKVNFEAFAQEMSMGLNALPSQKWLILTSSIPMGLNA